MNWTEICRLIELSQTAGPTLTKLGKEDNCKLWIHGDEVWKLISKSWLKFNKDFDSTAAILRKIVRGSHLKTSPVHTRTFKRTMLNPILRLYFFHLKFVFIVSDHVYWCGFLKIINIWMKWRQNWHSGIQWYLKVRIHKIRSAECHWHLGSGARRVHLVKGHAF